MVSLQVLYLFAAVALSLALAVAWLGRTLRRQALADACRALLGASLALAASTVLFALSRPTDASEIWRGAGSVAQLATPVGATLALRSRGRRSIPRALLASTVALAGVVLWLTLSLRGPRGGWTLAEVALVLPAAAIAVAAAACLGWWTKREAAGRAALAAGD